MVSPWGIAVDGGVVYVVDQGNSRIERFAVGGRYLGAFGTFGDGPGELWAPYAVAVRGGEVYVSDSRSDTIKVFTTSGRFLRRLGARGDGEGQFDQPAGLAFDREGQLLVADCANQRVQVLTTAGAFVEAFGEGRLRDPTFLATGSDGVLYVSDDRRVVRFDPAARSDAPRRPGAPPARLACTSETDRPV
jgi:tripartite motif-containing protein 71